MIYFSDFSKSQSLSDFYSTFLVIASFESDKDHYSVDFFFLFQKEEKKNQATKPVVMFCCLKPTRLTRQGRAKSRYSKTSDLTVRSTKDCMHTVQKPTLKSSLRIQHSTLYVCNRVTFFIKHGVNTDRVNSSFEAEKSKIAP